MATAVKRDDERRRRRARRGHGEGRDERVVRLDVDDVPPAISDAAIDPRRDEVIPFARPGWLAFDDDSLPFVAWGELTRDIGREHRDGMAVCGEAARDRRDVRLDPARVGKEPRCHHQDAHRYVVLRVTGRSRASQTPDGKARGGDAQAEDDGCGAEEPEQVARACFAKTARNAGGESAQRICELRREDPGASGALADECLRPALAVAASDEVPESGPGAGYPMCDDGARVVDDLAARPPSVRADAELRLVAAERNRPDSAEAAVEPSELVEDILPKRHVRTDDVSHRCLVHRQAAIATAYDPAELGREPCRLPVVPVRPNVASDTERQLALVDLQQRRQPRRGGDRVVVEKRDHVSSRSGYS